MTIVTQHRPAPSPTPHAAAAADDSFWTTLDASRRIDWRFLLPDLRLEKVAYMGPTNGALYESLVRFSDALTVIPDKADGAAADGEFKIVVCCGESGPAASRVIRLLRPGGFLYLETDRRARRRRRARAGPLPAGPLSEVTAGDLPRTAREWVRLLERSGFQRITLHWHWPDFDSCLEMVQLDDRAALLHVMSRRGSGPSARIKAAIGRTLIHTGLFPRMARCVSVLAQRPFQ